MRQYCAGGGAQNLGRFAPFALQPVKRRDDDQDHQGDLEEQIGDHQPPEAEQVEPMARRLMPNSVFSHRVTSPAGPSVAMKAKASGTPAKFEATPEKVSKAATAHTLWQAAKDHRRGHGKAPRHSPAMAVISDQLDRGPDRR